MDQTSQALRASTGVRLPASTSCCKQHSYLAGRGPNSNALHPPLAAVVAVAPSRGALGIMGKSLLQNFKLCYTVIIL